jgi:quercetin dioxygenase-like cupin family protein
MSSTPETRWRFVLQGEAQLERLPGKTHHWYCKPELIPGTDLMFVRAQLPPGQAHRFHYHPNLEEILYVLAGQAEQWVEREKRLLGPGDSVWLKAGVVHGTYNVGDGVLDFLAILTPARSPGPMTVEVSDQEPWRSLR